MPRRVTTRTSRQQSSCDPADKQSSTMGAGSAGHEQALDLQVATGNRAAPLVEQIGVVGPGAGGGPVIRRAGDKLAFEAVDNLPSELETRARDAVAGAIEEHRRKKRETKDFLEGQKEEMIDHFDKSKKWNLDLLRSQWPEGDEVLRFLEGQEEERIIGEHKKTLADYHDRVQTMSGWKWSALQNQIRIALRPVCKPVQAVVEVSDRESDMATVSVNGTVIYRIYFDDKRFDQQPDGGQGKVFTKKGYRTSGPQHGPDPRKQFVADHNNVKTRRFVTRAFNVFHLGAMFGISVNPPSWDDSVKTAPSASLEQKKEALKQNLARTNYRQKFEGGNETRFAGQEPRDLTKTFKEHATTFNLSKAASYLPGAHQNEFTTHYQPSGTSKGTRTGYELTKGQSGPRDANSQMRVNEASSMQVRNGSGRGQPFLSGASAQAMAGRPLKVIRANKGERFDTGAENQGIVKIDLSLMPQGVNVVDQHSDPSHQHKIAWDRYYGKDDIKALAERFALARKVRSDPPKRLRDREVEELVTRITPSEAEMKMFNSEDAMAIRSGDVTELCRTYDARQSDQKYTKREASKELDEYIYSARKNREVLFDKLPLSAVTEIYLSSDQGKWAHLDESVPRGQWVPLDSVKGEITEYLRGQGKYERQSEQEQPQFQEGGESFHHLMAMHEAAEYGKLLEGHTRS